MDKIIEKLVEALEQRIGNEISTSQLINEVYGVNCLRECVLEGISVDDAVLFDIDKLLIKAAKKKGIKLDSSKYYGQVVGLPYNVPFVIKKTKVRK